MGYRRGTIMTIELDRRTALQTLDGSGLVEIDRDRACLTGRGRLLASEVFLRLLPD